MAALPVKDGPVAEQADAKALDAFALTGVRVRLPSGPPFGSLTDDQSDSGFATGSRYIRRLPSARRISRPTRSPSHSDRVL